MAFDYEQYLLTELNSCKNTLGFDDFDIKISSERSFRMPKNSNNLLLFIIKRLTGTNLFNITNQPVQIICYSELNTMTVALQILDLFTKKHNNESFYSSDNFIKQTYDTVVTLRPMLQSEAGFKASLYCYGNYTVCSGLEDIKEFGYQYGDQPVVYENVNYTSIGIGYAAVLNTTKISGEEISTSYKQEAGLTITMQLLNDDSALCRKINEIMLGAPSGNDKFHFRWKLQDDSVFWEADFVLTNVSFISSPTSTPSLEVTFTR